MDIPDNQIWRLEILNEKKFGKETSGNQVAQFFKTVRMGVPLAVLAAKSFDILNDMSSNATILLAEDEETDAYFVDMAFKKAGLPHSISHVLDGQQVIEYLQGEGRFADRKVHPVPQLLLLDLKMPRVNGFDVLTWLQEHAALKSMPVVVLSSSDYPDDLETARKLGASDYQIKPSNPQRLVQFALDMDKRWLQSQPRQNLPS